MKLLDHLVEVRLIDPLSGESLSYDLLKFVVLLDQDLNFASF